MQSIVHRRYPAVPQAVSSPGSVLERRWGSAPADGRYRSEHAVAEGDYRRKGSAAVVVHVVVLDPAVSAVVVGQVSGSASDGGY